MTVSTNPCPTPTEILSQLHNRTITLPNLPALHTSFPLEVSPYLARLRTDVSDWLTSSMSHIPSTRLSALQAADFGYFGATWWARAPYQRLRILTFLAIWIFTWDDELDESEGEMYREDSEEAAELYREETGEYIRCCLGLSCDVGVVPGSRIVQNFETIGEGIRRVFDREQCARLAYHITAYINGCRTEESFRHAQSLPTLSQYWSYRLHSSAVCVTLAVNEFAFPGMRLPSHIMNSALMEELWTSANVVVSTVNDLLSLQKEVRGGNAGSMVPIVFARLGAGIGNGDDAQTAVDFTAGFLEENVARFEDAAEEIVRMDWGCSFKEGKMLWEFVDGVRLYVSGNLSWSLTGKRYGLQGKDLSRGVQVTL